MKHTIKIEFELEDKHIIFLKKFIEAKDRIKLLSLTEEEYKIYQHLANNSILTSYEDKTAFDRYLKGTDLFPYVKQQILNI